MTDNKEPTRKFLGTYFDADKVIQLARWAEILSWVVVAVYAVDLLVAAGTFALVVMRGFWGGGFTDLANSIILIVERPFRGVVYFIALQTIGKSMLILMDMEENTRRAARK
jgi:hypothetical protein